MSTPKTGGVARILGYSSPEELMASVGDLGKEMCVKPESRLEMKRQLEAALEIGMDCTRGASGFLASVNRPGARFFFARGEKRAEAEQVIHRADERVHPAVFDAEATQVFQRFFLAEID